MRVGEFRLPGTLALLVFTGVTGFAQVVISTQAGLINFTQEGARLNNELIQESRSQFRQMREQDVLSTARGRAEVLLTPGVFLRTGAQSSFRLISSQLADVRVEVLRGAVIVEAAELNKENSVTLLLGGAEVSVLKRGIYRLDANPPAARVFDGKLRIRSADREVEIGKGKTIALDGTLAVAKFDRKKGDWLDLWSRDRAAYLARVNRSTAGSLSTQRGFSRISGWAWNPMIGIYTFMPGRSYYYCSWYGACWYSPQRIYYVTRQRISTGYDAGGGGGGSGNSGPRISEGARSSSPASRDIGSRSREASPAPTAPAARSSGGGREAR